jgi:hypothetical protein
LTTLELEAPPQVDEQASQRACIVGPYHLEYEPTPESLIAIKRRGQVIHRSAGLFEGVQWAHNRLKEISNGQGRKTND